MAERELAAFQETLGVSQDHRAVIIKTIEQIGIVAECSDLIAKHALDAGKARNVVVKTLLGDQPLPLRGGAHPAPRLSCPT